MRTFSLSDLSRQSGDVVDAALVGPVRLTKHGKPKLVVMSVEAYDQLDQLRAFTVAGAPDHIHEELMQGLKDLLEDADAASTR
jgi:prevent-host-death family protein